MEMINWSNRLVGICLLFGCMKVNGSKSIQVGLVMDLSFVRSYRDIGGVEEEETTKSNTKTKRSDTLQ